MNATAQAAEVSRRKTASSSAPSFWGGSGTTTRSRSPRRTRGRRLPSRSTSPEIRKSRALPTREPLPDHDADADERARPQEPGHEPFRHRPDAADRPAAAVVRMLGVLDVADERVDLVPREVLFREARHHVRPDPYRLGDLPGRRVVERRRDRTGQVAARGDDLVAPGAVVGEQLLALREAALLGMRGR